MLKRQNQDHQPCLKLSRKGTTGYPCRTQKPSSEGQPKRTKSACRLQERTRNEGGIETGPGRPTNDIRVGIREPLGKKKVRLPDAEGPKNKKISVNIQKRKKKTSRRERMVKESVPLSGVRRRVGGAPRPESGEKGLHQPEECEKEKGPRTPFRARGKPTPTLSVRGFQGQESRRLRCGEKKNASGREEVGWHRKDCLAGTRVRNPKRGGFGHWYQQAGGVWGTRGGLHRGTQSGPVDVRPVNCTGKRVPRLPYNERE